MKRLDDGEKGSSPLISIRLPQKTSELLEALIANMPPHPIAGAPKPAAVYRAVFEAGLEVITRREGIQVGEEPSPIAAKPDRPKARKVMGRDGVMRAVTNGGAKTNGAPAVHRASRARAERRAAARQAAGCTCGRNHVRTCKLYPHPATA